MCPEVYETSRIIPILVAKLCSGIPANQSQVWNYCIQLGWVLPIVKSERKPLKFTAYCASADQDKPQETIRVVINLLMLRIGKNSLSYFSIWSCISCLELDLLQLPFLLRKQDPFCSLPGFFSQIRMLPEEAAGLCYLPFQIWFQIKGIFICKLLINSYKNKTYIKSV